MVDVSMNLTVTAFLAGLILLGASSAAVADRKIALPGYDQLLVVPYPDEGVAEGKEIGGVKFEMSKCDRIEYVLKFFEASFWKNNSYRTVTALVPASMRLTNHRVVNGLVSSAATYAWTNCYAGTVFTDRDIPDFSGVRVLIIQRKKVVIETGRVMSSDGGTRLRFSSFVNHIEERIAADKQATADADLEQQRVAFLQKQDEQNARAARLAAIAYEKQQQTTLLVVYGMLALGAIALGYRYIPRIATRIRWFFWPHPAFRKVRNATRTNRVSQENAKILAEALRFVPANETQQALARRDIARMKEHLAMQNIFVTENEKIAQSLFEGEMSKFRIGVYTKRR